MVLRKLSSISTYFASMFESIKLFPLGKNPKTVYCRVNTLTHVSLHLIQLNTLFVLPAEDASKDHDSKNLAPVKYMKLTGLLLKSPQRFL